MLQEVAHALGPLKDEVVFVGGTMPAVLITDPAAPAIRPTQDVDLIVDTRKHHEHADFEKRLRQRGFQAKPPPACRYGIGDVIVDVMTATFDAPGVSDQWYEEAFLTAENTTLDDGAVIRTIRAPLFIATKLDAWRERGQSDYYSHDLEDIIAVIDGRDVLLEEISNSSHDVRRFLAEAFAGLLADQDFRSVIPGHIGSGSVAAQRAEGVLRILEEISRLE